LSFQQRSDLHSETRQRSELSHPHTHAHTHSEFGVKSRHVRGNEFFANGRFAHSVYYYNYSPWLWFTASSHHHTLSGCTDKV